jgi:glycosyltransferase involved in cell wall biosynthesis
MGRLFPAADVAHGTFFYVFPHQGRRDAITLHDASFLDESFHPSEHIREMTRSIGSQIARCAAIACDSRAILSEVRERWPGAARKCRTIYPGAGWLAEPSRPRRDGAPGPAYILAVGTIEPRKNYALLLDAYEVLRSDLGARTPGLVIVGRPGWMQEDVCGRIEALAERGAVRWVKDAADPELAGWYENASVFSYLSLYEGFGYPPFEAALAGVPMVVSAASSIGEIWSGHACCVRPTDVRGIADAWKWAIGLGPAERRAVVERQRARAGEFSWKRCVTEYLGLYRELAAAPPG